MSGGRSSWTEWAGSGPKTRSPIPGRAELRVAEPEDMTPDRLAELGAEIGRVAGLIADSYFV